MPTDPEYPPVLGQELTANWPEQVPAGEQLGEMAGDLAAVSMLSEEEAEAAIEAVLAEEPPAGPSTFKEIASFILESLREGAMWAGWTPDGRPAFGDTGDPIPEDVTPEHAAEELAILAGVMTLDTVQKASMRLAPNQPGPSGPNRAQRRAASKAARRRRVV